MNGVDAATSAKLPETYAELVALHMPRPIHDKMGLEMATEMVDRLVGFRLNAEQEDYLDLLSQLIEKFEKETVPRPAKLKGVAALRFLLGEEESRALELAKILGTSVATAYKILQGKRRLTADHSRALSKRFHVSTDLFVA